MPSFRRVVAGTGRGVGERAGTGARAGGRAGRRRPQGDASGRVPARRRCGVGAAGDGCGGLPRSRPVARPRRRRSRRWVRPPVGRFRPGAQVSPPDPGRAVPPALSSETGQGAGGVEADGGADARRHGGRRHLRPSGGRVLPLLDRRPLAGPPLRENAHRSGPARPGLPPCLAGHGQSRLPRRGQRDVGFRPARSLDSRGRALLVLRRRCRWESKARTPPSPSTNWWTCCPEQLVGPAAEWYGITSTGQLGRPIHPGAACRGAAGPAG